MNYIIWPTMGLRRISMTTKTLRRLYLLYLGIFIWESGTCTVLRGPDAMLVLRIAVLLYEDEQKGIPNGRGLL